MKHYVPGFRKANATRVQCELYRILINEGFDVEVEYKLGNCRFDLVIVKGNEMVAIIETKQKTKTPTKVHGNQYLKYKAIGVPLFYTRGLAEIPKTLQDIKDLFKSV